MRINYLPSAQGGLDLPPFHFLHDGKQLSTDDGAIYARYLVAVDRIWYFGTLNYAEPYLISFIGARLRLHHLPSEK